SLRSQIPNFQIQKLPSRDCRQPGSQISIVSRSGSNQFHATLFDYVRNDVFDANDWFLTRSEHQSRKEGLSARPSRNSDENMRITLKGFLTHTRFPRASEKSGCLCSTYIFAERDVLTPSENIFRLCVRKMGSSGLFIYRGSF